ncbi:MAG: ATP-grasp domain-containing protein [Bacteroidota bacterium]|nr:ATP-grasp domain-containing protein [Bacteroidota bacterium]
MNSPKDVVLDSVHPRKTKNNLFFIKLFYYEYWPVWMVFFPSVFSYIYYAFKARSLTYFTATNPGIELGGFYGESKSAILKMIPSEFLPHTLFLEAHSSVNTILDAMRINNINFPIICKPDKGERGFMVEKILDVQQLASYLNQYDEKLIVQEFIEFDTELGILYFRFPDGQSSGISSIVMKKFLGVTGDGTSTIEQLMMDSHRATTQLKYFRKKHEALLSEILPKGKYVLLQPIGNHCKGTEFLNGAHLINKQLVEVFDAIASCMNGFYYGRFDVKISSTGEMYRGEGIRIMEVNGVSSEPGHIYDHRMNILKAWSAIIFNNSLFGRIAIQNNRRGVKYLPLMTVIKTVYRHFQNKS